MEDNEHKRINAFELWAYCQLLHIKWVEMHTNEWVVGKHGQKLWLECDLITEMIFGQRKHGRTKMRFVDNNKDIVGIGIARFVKEAEDRENWRRFCQGAMARLSQQPSCIVM